MQTRASTRVTPHRDSVRRHVIGALILAFAAPAIGCAGTQAYPGPRRDDSHIARLRGFGSPCGAVLEYSAVDGKYSGTALDLLPGPHRFVAVYTSEPFLSDREDGTSGFVPCVYRSRHSVRLTTEAGKTYWFSVNRAENRHHLVLHSSPEIGSAPGTPIPIEIEQESFEKQCGYSGVYWRCFAEEDDADWWRRD